MESGRRNGASCLWIGHDASPVSASGELRGPMRITDTVPKGPRLVAKGYMESQTSTL
jgi:hypothetical protein